MMRIKYLSSDLKSDLQLLATVATKLPDAHSSSVGVGDLSVSFCLWQNVDVSINLTKLGFAVSFDLSGFNKNGNYA